MNINKAIFFMILPFFLRKASRVSRGSRVEACISSERCETVEGYRLRVGDWRVIYHIDDKVLKILVIKIASRGGVYK